MAWYFWAALLAAGIVAFNFGVICVSLGPSKQFAFKEMGIEEKRHCGGKQCSKDNNELSRILISGAVFLGCAIGSICIGLLSHWGRRKCMILIHLLSIAGCGVAAIGKHWQLFALARLSAGVSVGMSGVASLYLGEICSSDKRGLYGALYSVFVTLGELLISLWQLSHAGSLDSLCTCDSCCCNKDCAERKCCCKDGKLCTNSENCCSCTGSNCQCCCATKTEATKPVAARPEAAKTATAGCGGKLEADKSSDKAIWRMGQLYGALASLVALCLLFMVVVDDTPFMLVKRGEHQKAKEVLALLQGPDKVESSFQEIMEDVASEESGAKKMGLWEALSYPDSRRALLVVFAIAILRQLCGIYVFTLSASEMFGMIVGQGLGATAMGNLCPLTNFIVCCLLPLYIDKFGRRKLLIYGSGIGTSVLAVCLLLNTLCGDGEESSNSCRKDSKKEARWPQYLMIFGCMVFVAAFATGYGGVAWLYFSEALGAEYRDAGFAVASALNWLAAALVVMTADKLRSVLSKNVYWVYVFFSFISCLFAIFFVRETKGVPLGQAYIGGGSPWSMRGTPEPDPYDWPHVIDS
ncbi:hexose transporter, putative [Babesia bigemina]|uniref:Hexose transporter, putative n=1 Tax=Babesia bigemina TaxID=5866 RepID=A0A061D233_BABBI|nr:hexose transporter, putative [Babesia bigemina]CDR94801.1 hexose transporter, putative [Babesia bigemina]|eukprot:XP_012766987.1 hexose transporter, putative [Babesia bigemina]